MNNFSKYLIMFVCFVALASAYTARVDSYNQTEIETKLVSTEVSVQAPVVQLITQISFDSSFPHHINLHPQLEIQEFIKPPSA